jgi:translocation and assembly module TamB
MAPKLPDDVFVKASENGSHVLKNVPETGQQLNIPVRLAVDVDLGDDSKILGQGLDVRLAGSVHLENEKHTLIPSAIGKVTIPYGRYKAYGQELDIDRSSTISFDGLLDDPHIYVIAKRRFSPVGAGIKISGRVSKREMTLIADEPLSERDKFAWLALGRSGSSNEDDASLMLATSAGSLLAQGLNAELGIFDTLGLSSKEGRRQGDGSLSPSEQIITIGKQLSKELSIGYEYSLNTSKQVVRVAYEFKRNWSAIIRFGNSPSVEGRYSKRFD